MARSLTSSRLAWRTAARGVRVPSVPTRRVKLLFVWGIVLENFCMWMNDNVERGGEGMDLSSRFSRREERGGWI